MSTMFPSYCCVFGGGARLSITAKSGGPSARKAVDVDCDSVSFRFFEQIACCAIVFLKFPALQRQKKLCQSVSYIRAGPTCPANGEQ